MKLVTGVRTEISYLSANGNDGIGENEEDGKSRKLAPIITC